MNYQYSQINLIFWRLQMTTRSKAGTCKIEALVSIDERGQMVIPKEIRDLMGVQAGDKMACVVWEKEGKACCITLIPVVELASGITSFINSVMGSSKEV